MSYSPIGDGVKIPVERVSALLAAALELASEHELDALLAVIVARARDVVDAQFGALGIYDENGTLTRFVHDGIDADTVEAIGEYPTGRGLLGKVVVSSGPIRLTDLSAEPSACGFPANHPAMRTFLGVPVRSGGRQHGNLYLTDKRSGNFDEIDEQLVIVLARFAAAAIDNALLVEADREHAESLTLVAAAETRERAQREILERVIVAQEAERARVARDLHDQIGQSLTAILLALQILGQVEPGSEEARHRQDELRELVTGTLDEVRELAFELRPTILDDIGLVAALERLVESQRNLRGVHVDLRVAGLNDSSRMPGDTETVIYRVVQEALTNVARHAHVERATVDLYQDGNQLHVVISDDGDGFDLEQVNGSLGLNGMAERAALIGASLTIDSRLGVGTRVQLAVPVD